MKIPTKFEVNTEDFKIYFDNNKKTHICESLDTGEQTNVGVLGILMQMGIIKPVEVGIEEKIKTLSERLKDLETKINDIIRKVDNASVKPKEEKVMEIKEEKESEEPEEIETSEEPEEEDEPKSEINKRIMRKVLQNREEDDEEVEIEEDNPNVKKESDEEINNWTDI
jgi:hypothetical protein